MSTQPVTGVVGQANHRAVLVAPRSITFAHPMWMIGLKPDVQVEISIDLAKEAGLEVRIFQRKVQSPTQFALINVRHNAKHRRTPCAILKGTQSLTKAAGTLAWLIHQKQNRRAECGSLTEERLGAPSWTGKEVCTAALLTSRTVFRNSSALCFREYVVEEA